MSMLEKRRALASGLAQLPKVARLAVEKASSRALSEVRGTTLGDMLHDATRPLTPLANMVSPGTNFAGDCMRWSIIDEVLEVELHRQPCNEIGTTMLGELELLCALLREGAGGVSSMLIYSSVEKGFSAGADLRELHAEIDKRGKGGQSKLGMAFGLAEFLDRIHAVMDTLDSAPLTTVAAVHGFCFGGGFELALTADIIVADKSARFCFPELRLGLVPGFGGIPRLERDVGNAVVRDLMLTGRSLRASRAYEVGLVSQLVARGRAVEVARLVARQARAFDQATIADAKAFIKPIPRERLRQEKRVFLERFASPVVEEALRRFVSDESAHPYLPDPPKAVSKSSSQARSSNTVTKTKASLSEAAPS